MNVNIIKKYVLIGVAVWALALSACNHYVDKTNARIETVLEKTETYRERATVPDLPEPVDTVRVNNDIWLGNTSVKIMEGDALPSKFEYNNSITLAITQNEPLSVLATELTDLTGIEVRLDDLKAENALPKETVAVNYSGKLSGLLNYLSNRYGVWWRYKNGQISFFNKETRVFTIYALPNETKMSADLKGSSMGTGGKSGSSSNSGSSSLSTTANLALWDSIEKGLRQVVGKQGELSFSRVTGTVTVTASPFVMQKVASYIANWNDKLSRQVAISIKVLQVQLTNEDNYGLDLQAVFKSNNIDTSFSSPYSLTSSATATGTTAGLLSMTLLRPSSRWKDSRAIIEAFSTQGKTSIVTSSSVTTLNNKVAPVQITTAQNYVREVSVTNNYNSSNNSSDVDLDTDTLNYGFSMEILPRILDHGRLIILFTMTLSDLIALETFSSGTSGSSESGDTGESTTVQLPKMQMRGFMQEIAMKSGSTLVLTGFEQVMNTTSTSGVGEAKMNLLGGKAQDQHRRDVMVILLTPEVLESPMSPESRMREF